MRGSRRKDRRLRRVGATFSLVGLVMTVFLAIGLVGLIAANADGWSDGRATAPRRPERTRRRLHCQGIGRRVREEPSSKDAVAAPLVAARAVDVGDIELDWIAAGPYTYNHSTLAGTGPGLPGVRRPRDRQVHRRVRVPRGERFQLQRQGRLLPRARDRGRPGDRRPLDDLGRPVVRQRGRRRLPRLRQPGGLPEHGRLGVRRGRDPHGDLDQRSDRSATRRPETWRSPSTSTTSSAASSSSSRSSRS